MIKVLHLITKLEFGGAQQNTLHTVSELNRSEFEVHLACGRGGYLDRRAEQTLPPHEIHWLRFMIREIRPWTDFLAFLELCLLLRRLKPQIIHTHSSKAGILGRWAAFFAGVPIRIHTFHGFGFHDFQKPWVKAAYVIAERLTAWISTQLIYVSKDNEEYARRHGIRHRRPPALIRSGVRRPERNFPLRSAEKESKKTAMGLPKNSLSVVTVGNLKAQKNPGHFIELARKFEKSDPPVHFLFIGGTEENAALERFGKPPANFSYLGWREDAREITAAADVFVMTSLWEGLPRSAVEALWMGVPVCAYATDGLKELVINGVNGFLAAPGEIAALSERLREILSSEGIRAKMAENAVKSIGREFDINEMVTRQETLYKELLK